MSRIPFADIFKQHTVGVTDPYWRTVELRRALYAKYYKEYHSSPLLQNLLENTKLLSKDPKRLPQ